MPSKPPTKSNTGIISYRASQLYITPPGPLGFNAFLEPEDPFGDGLKFKVNQHFTDEAVERLILTMDRDVVDANWDAFLKACEKAGKDTSKMTKPSSRDWVTDHLKQPKEGAKQQLPFIMWSNAAEFKDRDGNTQRKTMRAYDAKGKLLEDVAGLRMGYGSIVQTVLMPGLFVTPIVKQPQPTLKLQGLRILKLEQYGSGGGALGEVSEEDMELLGNDVEADDLSAYTQAASPGGKAPKPAHDADLDDELPF